MKVTCLLALASATILAACGAEKPAPPDKVTEPVASADSVRPPAAVAPTTSSAAEPKTAPVPASVARIQPPSKANQPAPAATAPVQPAPTPAPVVTKPAMEPAPPPKPAAAPAAATAVATTGADPMVGKPLYAANCRKCHGVIGVPAKAIKAKFPKILPFDADYFGKTTDEAVVTILMQGKGDDMKPFKDTLSKAEMLAVAAYIRTLGKR